MCHRRVRDAHLGPGISDIGAKNRRHSRIEKRPTNAHTEIDCGYIRSETLAGLSNSNIVPLWEREVLVAVQSNKQIDVGSPNVGKLQGSRRVVCLAIW